MESQDTLRQYATERTTSYPAKPANARAVIEENLIILLILATGNMVSHQVISLSTTSQRT